MSYRELGRSGSTKNFYIAKWYVQDTKYPVLLSFLIDRKYHGLPVLVAKKVVE